MKSHDYKSYESTSGLWDFQLHFDCIKFEQIKSI